MAGYQLFIPKSEPSNSLISLSSQVKFAHLKVSIYQLFTDKIALDLGLPFKQNRRITKQCKYRCKHSRSGWINLRLINSA